MQVCDACAKHDSICSEEVDDFRVYGYGRGGPLAIQVQLCKGCRDHLMAAMRHYIGLGPEKVRF